LFMMNKVVCSLNV